MYLHLFSHAPEISDEWDMFAFLFGYFISTGCGTQIEPPIVVRGVQFGCRNLYVCRLSTNFDNT